MGHTTQYAMQINVENTIRQASTFIDNDYYKFSLKELVNHLKILKKEHEKGNSKDVLDAFFNLYVFDEDQGE